MTQEQFIARRRAGWDELEALVRAVRSKGAAALPLDQLRRLGELYRMTAGDLAYARTYFPHGQVTIYLNQLVAAAHGVVYAAAPRSGRELLRQFVHGIPAAVRQAWRPLLLAVLLMAGAALAGAGLTYWNEDVARTWLPPQFQEMIPTMPAEEPFAPEERPLISALIFFNNARVAILSWALGLTMGIGTAYILVTNGLMVGILAAMFYKYGVEQVLWSLILPHGCLELLTICLAGAAGFRMATALIQPGRQTRGAALVERFRQSLPILLAAVVYLLVAAAIEGFFTPVLALPDWLKVSVGVLAASLALMHWILGGRRTVYSRPISFSSR